MSASQNYYKLLRIREDAPDPVIKQAFRKLARECHPDLHPDNPEAEVMFKLLQEAYDVLGDRVKRRQYDRLRTLTGSGEGFDLSSGPSVQTESSSQLIDPARMYSLGVELASQRKYDLADQRFSQAIELNPDFLEAYMGRCQVRYVLGDDQGVLNDCSAIIQLRAKVPQAHYYQGRSRYRLNYVEHAIQAYSKAISLDEKYASAYFHRGIARSDMRQRKGAIADFKAASQLYRLSGNQKGLMQAESQLRHLRRQSMSSPAEKLQSLGSYLNDALVNPVGTITPLFKALSSAQSAQLGFAIALLTITAIVLGGAFFLSSQFSLDWYQLVLLGATPFVLNSLICSLLSMMGSQQRGNWSGDVFIAAVSVAPIGLAGLLTGLQTIFGIRFLWALGFVTLSLSTLIFYTGLVQISRLSESQATWIVILTGILNFWALDSLLQWFTA